jgi:NAD(P)-dependent dehydrogenase (short-subunit alcohol dehydrogenase family)
MKSETLFDVRGLSALVTGAASGIGFGYAEVMAANGAHVMLADADAARLDTAVADLQNRGNGAAERVAGVVADVTRPETLTAAVDAVLAQRGRLDVLFANAGISAGPGFMQTDGARNAASAFESLSLETFDRALAVNLRGAFLTMQAAVPAMKRQGGGRIIVTTTISLMRTELHVSTLYVASKAALGQLVRQAALELAAYGILVNGIAPGPTITNIGNGRLKDAMARQPFERLNPLHRLAEPADLYGAALFLASPASAYVTGTQLVVDGGACLGSVD